MGNTLLWVRQALRLQDNPLLHKAVKLNQPILPVWFFSPEEMSPWQPGGASQWWLHHSLVRLTEAYQQHGLPLTLQRTNSVKESLLTLIEDYDISHVIYDISVEPALRRQAKDIEDTLGDMWVTVDGIHANTLLTPEQWLSQSGKPYQVYTPFWKHTSKQSIRPPFDFEDIAKQLPALKMDTCPASLSVDELGLLPTIPWDKEFYQAGWQPGETGAMQALNTFLNDGLAVYKTQRDVPYQSITSKLSPHLHFGEITPATIWKKTYQFVEAKRGEGTSLTSDEEHFLKEVMWREFAYNLLWYFPETPEKNLRPAFDEYPWANEPGQLAAWQQGKTGYPIVDAGMRELWHTGIMHNRVRMIVASFLIKHLRIDWRHGAAWFWDTLLDADLASNTLGWQWVAGSGADAAPYFRVFNPITQGKKFDTTGDYVRQWVPELANLPDDFIHCPWDAPALVLLEAGITLGITYPHPLVDHAEARQAALAGYELVKQAK